MNLQFNISIKKLKSINLSISNLCEAKCVYCPERGNGSLTHMPLETAKKIIDEISSEEFQRKHNIEMIEFSENGDCFLNPDCLEIMRYTRRKLPNVKKQIFTNFNKLIKSKSETIINEKLVDYITFNLDGNEENYFKIKGIKREKVIENLKVFIELRKQYKSNIKLTALILTLHNYVNTISKNFHFYPRKLKDYNNIEVKNDLIETSNELKQILDPELDRINKSGVFAWAERSWIKTEEINYKDFVCPFLNRVETECFIAPNGDWYICCLDSRNEIVFGNVLENPIDEIFESELRKEIIKKLKNKEFEKIGGPCRTVNCCRVLGG